MMWKRLMGATTTIGFVAGSVLAGAVPAQAAGSQVETGTVVSGAVGGTIDYTVYLPDGYDPAGGTRYPTLYLLHGRGDSQAAWQQEMGDLDELIASGTIAPMIVVMPDAPWSNRGSYYVDSLYTGDDPGTAPGAAVETAFTTDLVDHIDASYRTIDDRGSRAIGGYSMGGAGALRYATTHQDIFSSAIVLSPAVYVPSTPVDSSTREFGAYGVGAALYDESRYQALNYPAAFASFDAALPVHLFIAVGDDEYANPKPEDAIHDLDYEAATLYNQAKRVPGITAELRVYNGGHDWGVWKQGLREGLADLAAYLHSTPPAPFHGVQFGSAGDDRAGGIIGRSDGGTVQVINSAGAMLDTANQGGFDILVQRRSTDGIQVWLTPIATPLNDRAYGVIDGGDDSVVTAGFMRQDHAAGAEDDALVSKLGPTGVEVWRTTFGSDSAADRIYGIAPDGEGGAFVTGYTSGALPGGMSTGDKDAFVAHVDSTGTVMWATQFGGPGEDKGFGVVAGPNGSVYVGGTAGASMPGTTAAGASDGWIARFDSTGARQWLNQVGTAENDQVSALVATASGIAATGFTGGVLGTASAGDTDAFVTAMSVDGEVQWTTQDGSAGDDRGASIGTNASGDLFVVGSTSGHIADSVGGVDVFTLTLTPTGTVSARTQFGSPQRDGADEFDEANLYVAAGAPTWIQGLTYGNVSGATNGGAGDVFLAQASFDAVDGVPPADNANTGGSAQPGSDGSAPAAVPGLLGLTGVDSTRWIALAILVLLVGGSLLWMRKPSVRCGVE